MKIRFVVIGECCSMKNQRIPKPITRRDGSAGILWIKSAEAQDYEKSVLKQIPPKARQQLVGPVRVTLRMYYATNRKDMDEALLLDCMQTKTEEVKGKLIEIAPGEWAHSTSAKVVKYKGVYGNDSQIKERHVYWFLDPANPRVEVEVEPLEMQQAAMPLEVAPDGKDPF